MLRISGIPGGDLPSAGEDPMRTEASWRARIVAADLSTFGEIGIAVACAAGAVAIRLALDPWLAHQHAYTIAFAATAIAALVGNWRAGVLCAVLAQVSSNILFVEPRGVLSADSAQAITFYLMTIVMLCVTNLAVRAHRAARSVLRRLQQADAAKSELLATIAHELRNPVGAIGLAIACVENAPDRAASEKAIRVMRRQITYVNRLVEDLTDASRIQSGKVSLLLQEHALPELLARAQDLVEPSVARRRQTIVIECSQPLKVRGDDTRLVQVLANVLHNASKYSPEESAITVSAEGQHDRVCITVRDEGVGIPKEQLESVFDAYAQLKPGSDGLGLGLSLVRKLVELHGGSIKALSAGPGKGTAIEICLPAGEVADPI